MRWGFTWVGLGLCAGCGAVGPAASSTTASGHPQTVASAHMTEAERLSRAAAELWPLRADPAKRGAALAELERAAEADPSRHRAWADLARGHHFAARMAGADGDREQQRAHHEAGLQAAVRALPASPESDEAIAAVEASAVPALYWWAVHRMAAARLAGYGEVVLARGPVIAALSRARELDPETDHRGPDRELGRIRARASFTLHDARKAARAHSEAAAKAAPDYLDNRLRLAADVAVAMQDRETFERELRAVLEANPKVRDAEPENRLAQREARELLDRAGELFE